MVHQIFLEIMIGKGYDYSVILGYWHLDIQMIYGYTPFADFESNNTHDEIVRGISNFPTDGNPDPIVKKLIKSLLAKK